MIEIRHSAVYSTADLTEMLDLHETYIDREGRLGRLRAVMVSRTRLFLGRGWQ